MKPFIQEHGTRRTRDCSPAPTLRFGVQLLQEDHICCCRRVTPVTPRWHWMV